MIPEENVLEPISLSLAPYTGTWTRATAAHLLRRTMFGATYAQITQAFNNGMNATVATLLTPPAQTEPLTYHPDEAVAAFGSEWSTAFYPASNQGGTDQARKNSLGAWMMQRLNDPTMSIQEKICLFWWNHFGMDGNSSEAKTLYHAQDLFRTHCLGNFKTLVKEITISPLMLIFLNGSSNNQFAPNENYARELLELFSVGKGLQVGPGDYSTYTEADIAAAAKVLTGWVVTNLYSTSQPMATSSFYSILHDTSSKTFSNYFGNTTLNDAQDLEYDNLIEMIFSQPNMAKHICRKLYRWLVNYDLTPTVESTVIADMATTLQTNGFNITPVLDELLKSEHFYDISVRGAIIKSPLECLFSMVNVTSSSPNFDLATNYEMYLNLYYGADLLGQNYFRTPSVGGWTAYYQQPSFSKLWANSSYIKLRFDIGAYLTVATGIPVNGNFFKLDCLTFVNGLSAPATAQQVIDDMAEVFTPKGLSVATKTMLKLILTNGQPDFEWTLQYNEYLADPGNPTVANPVRQRIELVLYRLFQLPEFQTI